MASSPPNSRTNLDKAIQRLYGQRARFVEARSILARTVVGQLLPDAVAKGGGALQLRFGGATTRATFDFDAARRGALDAFVETLGRRLREGWNGFTGVVVAERPARPRGVPGEYVMRPFSVKLAYRGHPWCTVALEVGHDEIGDADEPEFVLAPEIAEMFSAIGLPAPAPVPLRPLAFQVAQKLHAATSPGNQRAHDLIDLQLIAARTPLDLPRIRALCVRLFDYRRMQPWPPRVEALPGWDDIYRSRSAGLPVLPTIEEAVAWANALVAKIDAATNEPVRHADSAEGVK